MVRGFILADPALKAALGTRVYPLKLPQSVTYPAMTLMRVSTTTSPPLRGGRASLARPRYQADIWTYEGGDNAFETCQQIGDLLRARLEGATVQLLDTSVTPAAWRYFAFELADDQDIYEQPGEGGGGGGGGSGGYFRYSADFLISHQTGQGPST